MKNHTQVQSELLKALKPYGRVVNEPSISFEFGNRKYRPDIIFENTESNKKLIIEFKSSQMGFTLNSASFVVELKNFIDNNSEYKFALILTDELTPNLSKYITGRVNYFSLKEHKMEEIVDKLLILTK